jgi:hypothetical protein
MSTGARFAGTFDQAAAHNVFALPSQPPVVADAWGTILFGGSPFLWNPFIYKHEGYAPGTVVRILGTKDAGKTALAKVLASGLGIQETASGQRMRITVDDTRQNDGVPEYAEFAKAMGGESVSLASHQINFLDQTMGASFSEYLGTAKLMYEHVSKQALGGKQPLALQVALAKTIRLHGNATEPKYYLKVLRQLSLRDLVEYQVRLDDDTLANVVDISGLRRNFGGRPSTSMSVADMEQATNISFDEFRNAAGQCYAVLLELLNGTYENMFGGNNSLAEMLSQPVVVLDYTGIDIDALVLIQSLLWRWRTSAVRRGDKRFMSNIEIHDENYGMWEHLPYAKNMYKHIKTIRGTGELVLIIHHRIDDNYAVGSAGSEQRELAVNSLSDTDMWFIGHTDAINIPRLQKRLNLDDWVCNHITKLQQGEFYYVMGDRKPVPFKLYLEPTYKKRYTESNMATQENLGPVATLATP